MKKKNNLSRITGPPIRPPYWLRLSAGFSTFDALLKNEFAENLALRLVSKIAPRNVFVPDGVIMRTEVAPPAESAPDTDVVIENSATLSDVGRFGRKSSEFVRMKLSWMLMPSRVTCVHVGRPPLTVVFARVEIPATPACSLIRLVMSRFASGMSSTCFCTTVLVTSGVVVATSDAPATTVTDSVIAPSSSFAVSAYSCPTASFTSV